MTAPINYYRAIRPVFDGSKSNSTLIKPETLIIWGALDTALNVRLFSYPFFRFLFRFKELTLL